MADAVDRAVYNTYHCGVAIVKVGYIYRIAAVAGICGDDALPGVYCGYCRRAVGPATSICAEVPGAPARSAVIARIAGGADTYIAGAGATVLAGGAATFVFTTADVQNRCNSPYGDQCSKQDIAEILHDKLNYIAGKYG